MKNAIKLFEHQKIRTKWNEDEEKWYFSIVDIVAILTEQVDFQTARKYWNKLSQRLKEEGSEVVTNCHRLKLLASDGKLRETDCADTEQLLRLIQSIPSKKAEPFKMWLAEVGNERIDEMSDPELTIDRAMKTYLQKGYSKDWINQRLKTIEVRKELTDEWNRVGINKQNDYAILTNEITKAWSGKTIKDYKQFKGLKKENLRDNMTNIELVLNMLAEAATKEISEKEDPSNFDESKDIAKEGGATAKVAKDRIEKRLGEKVVTKKNAEEIHFKDKNKIEHKE
ncbi:Bro-N domain-containing protein [Candidatus Woesearchaeota archaeon]|nr:Bro-N domain-containing protein [Candidatus Woesearchaeota archaeon]